jgi:hypothetical protein
MRLAAQDQTAYLLSRSCKAQPMWKGEGKHPGFSCGQSAFAIECGGHCFLYRG